MTDRSESSGQGKASKSPRKSLTSRGRSEANERLTPQLPQRLDADAKHSRTDADSDYIRVVIANLTSDADDPQTADRDPSTSPTRREPTLPKRPTWSATKPPRPSKRSVAPNQGEDKSLSTSRRLNSTDQKFESSARSLSIGERRLDQLTKIMKEFYENCSEFAPTVTNQGPSDAFDNAEKRKQYSTNLWYELKTFFSGTNTLDEHGIEVERLAIDQHRRRSLDEFYKHFNQCDFEQANYRHIYTIQRRHLCESHVAHCHDVEKYLQSLFSEWDAVLALFPSYAALEQYDKRFNPSTKDGRIFYEKLVIFQAWFNLHSEINRLVRVLGRLMSCTQCDTWPDRSQPASGRASANTSRPQTPTAIGGHEQKDTPVHPTSPVAVLETRTKRQNTLTSMSSIDSIYQQHLAPHSPLTDYYDRYIDDQVTHARIELVASIFRSKHGPLLQRLRYTYRKEHRTSASVFDDIFRNSPFLPTRTIPSDYLSDAKPDRLIDEFLVLNKQLQEQKNPLIAVKNKKRSHGINYGQVNNILHRFEQNPTLTSSTFSPAPAPTLVLKLQSHDRSILKRQSYFLDYLDPTSYPHLPGSTLFPDPCLFLDSSPLNFHTHLTSDESIMIAKMLTICRRLYDKHVWVDSGRFSDMCDIFHLPSLYPQYVFLVQIPLDLINAWHRYHLEKKMEQTPTTNALLLLIDECKLLIHSATLVRQYIKRMVTDTFEKAELKMIAEELVPFDRSIVDTIVEVMTYIERYVEIALRSEVPFNCVTLLKDQWKSLSKYSTMMNVEEMLGERFLNLYANIIQHFHGHINVIQSSLPSTVTSSIDHIKAKISRRYKKKLAMSILREAKAIYENYALAINIYLQKPVCKRFLLILKTAGFRRIDFASDNHQYPPHYHHPPRLGQANKDGSPASKCLLFAPAEFFDDAASRIQLIRILSSSFRIVTNNNLSTDSTDEQLPLCPPQQQQPSPTSAPHPPFPTSETSPPLVYILCVPIAVELESEWTGITHIIPENKTLTSILPLHTHWKTTTIFLLTQQTDDLEAFEASFRERLSKVNVQQSDLYNFDAKTKHSIQKRSCFEKVDDAMRNLAHSILSLGNCIATNVERFEMLVDRMNTRDYVHAEERAFAFAMDIIRETSFYATQCEHETLKVQAERQLTFAQHWLNFVPRKKVTTSSRYLLPIPMWLLPGIQFLRHICSLQFTSQIDDQLFGEFYRKVRTMIKYLNNPDEAYLRGLHGFPWRTLRYSSAKKRSTLRRTTKKVRLSQIEQLDRMDRRIDRRRLNEDLIGRIKAVPAKSSLTKKKEEDLALHKIRDFHKVALLSCGQFATTYKCWVNRNGKKETLCYKQYKIQHNDASAIDKILELMPLMHIEHENLIKYHGIALEHDHILFFMDYCSHGTIAQLLLGTSLSSPASPAEFRPSLSLSCSFNETNTGDNGLVQTPAGFIFLRESLVQRYLSQLLSALSCLHKKDIIHRDIRNVNIFFADVSKQSIKLGDVNFVYDFKFMQKQSSLLDVEELINVRESIVFYAPETITQRIVTTKSDIWSLGCTAIHMLTGHIPWSNPRIASSVYYLKIRNWIADGVHPPIPTDLNLSCDCIHFLKECFQHDPNRRLSSHQLLEHPFIKE